MQGRKGKDVGQSRSPCSWAVDSPYEQVLITPGKGNGSVQVTGRGVEYLTRLTRIRADFLVEGTPELSHERRGRRGRRGLPGRGV